MKILSALAVLAFAALSADAASPVVRPAPDFGIPGVSKKSLRSLRGQPVVVVVAKNPKDKVFKKQLAALAMVYQEFASRGTVFIAAFSEEGGQIPSNIPFVVANNGPSVASAYGLTGGFGIAIIGQDGNLDLTTDKVLPGLRIREVILNSYPIQNAARKELPKGPTLQ